MGRFSIYDVRFTIQYYHEAYQSAISVTCEVVKREHVGEHGGKRGGECFMRVHAGI
jgi:hypothetical protein